MSVPGSGWARRVTIETLSGFRSLLRTGAEHAAEAQISQEVASDEVSEDNPPALEETDVGSTVMDTGALFDGIPVQVPIQYRSQRQGATALSVDPSASPSITPSQREADSLPSTEPLYPVPVRRWFKRMSAADAQRPQGQNTNPTGHLTLTQGGNPIQQATWFREDLFIGEDWAQFTAPSGRRERATITFQVQIAGEDIGEVALEVRYTPSFESGQGNRTTTLHWGTTMGNRFRQNDYTNYYVTIERSESGEFLMVIDTSPSGPFVG